MEKIMADIINGLFEVFASLFIFLNICKLYKDKQVKGVSIISVIFFTLWSIWNLWFYPSLEQWWSFIGGIGVMITNTFWVCQMVYYRKNSS
jgi:uncharacterized membrane protein YfcA